MPEFSAADTQAPAASGGGPHWLLIGGAVAAGLGLLVFLKGKSGGAGAAPVQTQESLATGDLAYQVQNGLGALGIQSDRNAAAVQSAVGAWGSSISGSQSQMEDAARARYLMIQQAIGAWGLQGAEGQNTVYNNLWNRLDQLFSQLQFRPPDVFPLPIAPAPKGAGA